MLRALTHVTRVNYVKHYDLCERWTAAVSSDHGREDTPDARRASRARVGRAAARGPTPASSNASRLDRSKGGHVFRSAYPGPALSKRTMAICMGAVHERRLRRRDAPAPAGAHARRLSATSVRVGGSGACGAALSAHDGQLGGDDERSAQPTTMAEVDADGEQRAAAASGMTRLTHPPTRSIQKREQSPSSPRGSWWVGGSAFQSPV